MNGKTLNDINERVKAEILKTGYFGKLWSANVYVSKQTPRKRRKIIGQQFKQISSFRRKLTVGRNQWHKVFFRETVTVTGLGSGKSLSLYGPPRKFGRRYSFNINGSPQLGCSASYTQLRKHYQEV